MNLQFEVVILLWSHCLNVIPYTPYCLL